MKKNRKRSNFTRIKVNLVNMETIIFIDQAEGHNYTIFSLTQAERSKVTHLNDIHLKKIKTSDPRVWLILTPWP